MATIEIQNRYKWSKLGSYWLLLSFGIYSLSVSIVYSHLFSIPQNRYLPYLASGLITWTLVQSFYVEGISLFANYKGYIVNINLPFYVYSMILITRNTLILLLQLPILVLIKLIYNDKFGWNFIIFPFYLIIIMMIGILIAGTLAPLGVVFKDLNHLIPAISTVLTLITPILYPAELLKNASWLYELNPMYYFVTLVRDPLLGNSVDLKIIFVCVSTILVLGLLHYLVNNILDKKIVPLI